MSIWLFLLLALVVVAAGVALFLRFTRPGFDMQDYEVDAAARKVAAKKKPLARTVVGKSPKLPAPLPGPANAPLAKKPLAKTVALPAKDPR